MILPSRWTPKSDRMSTRRSATWRGLSCSTTATSATGCRPAKSGRAPGPLLRQRPMARRARTATGAIAGKRSRWMAASGARRERRPRGGAATRAVCRLTQDIASAPANSEHVRVPPPARPGTSHFGAPETRTCCGPSSCRAPSRKLNQRSRQQQGTARRPRRARSHRFGCCAFAPACCALAPGRTVPSTPRETQWAAACARRALRP